MSKKVLVIEDSSLMQGMVRSILKKNGFIAYESSNGSKALAVARDVSPDVILLDVRMPIMDGMTTYKELRSNEWGKHIPVIMLTSTDDQEVLAWIAAEGLENIKKDESMEARLVDVLSKRFGAA